jgi:GTP-binding protein Era
MTRPATPTRSGRVAIVGRPNVGKSTLLNALLGEPIAITSAHPQTTRDAVRGVRTEGQTQIVFVDTPGMHHARNRLGHKMNHTAREQAREADAIVLVVEPAIDARDLKLAADLPKLPTLLAINKIDRIKNKGELLPMLAAFNEKHPFAAIVPISARRTEGTEGIVKELALLMPEQPFLYPADTLSDQPVRFFVAEFVREKILANTKQEVPHGVAVVVERFDESTKIPHIEVAVHVAREAHKKILVGARGQMMKTIGMAARARVEAMLGKQVHLKLWVRSSPDWMDDPNKLDEMGYGAHPAAEASDEPGPHEGNR